MARFDAKFIVVLSAVELVQGNRGEVRNFPGCFLLRHKDVQGRNRPIDGSHQYLRWLAVTLWDDHLPQEIVVVWVVMSRL